MSAQKDARIPAMKIGYARVSTDEQNLALQLHALDAAGRRWSIMDGIDTNTAAGRMRQITKRAMVGTSRSDGWGQLENPKILICGAGIAGSTIAYWLQQYGFEPTLIERAPALREGGYTGRSHGARAFVLTLALPEPK